jgi:Asp-tRNA(Asn)/Glu-tRNA(Gln) amidotransferase B subunit
LVEHYTFNIGVGDSSSPRITVLTGNYNIMLYYISEKTGNKYPKDEFINHGWGGIKNGFKDLPLDEYPYTIVNDDVRNEYHDVGYFELETSGISDYDRRFASAAAKWILGPVLAYVNKMALKLEDIESLVDVYEFKKLIAIVEFTDIIDFSNGKRVYERMIETGEDCWSIIDNMGFLGTNDSDELNNVIISVLNDFPDKVSAYRAGNVNLLSLFIGETMKRVKGFNGKDVRERILSVLSE